MTRILVILLAAVFCWVTPGYAKTASLHSRIEKLTKKQYDGMMDFVMGNAMFIMFHESGHMLVDELKIPVLSKEEDAVDAMSTIFLLQAEDDLFDAALIDSTMGWMLMAADDKKNGNTSVMWGKHGLNEQRAFNIMCYMVGKDPKKFGDFAKTVGLPKDRQYSCSGDFEDLSKGWENVLSPHMRSEAGPSPFTIEYDDTDDPDLQPFAEAMKERDTLSAIDTMINGLFEMPEPIKLVGTTCGEENAYWSNGKKQITYCYEFLAMHARLYLDYYID